MRIAILTLAALTLTGCPPGLPPGEGGVEGEGDGEAVDFGFVFVTSEPALGFAQAVAVFRRGQKRAFDCAEREVAGCVVLECGDAALPVEPIDAGAIEVEGTLVPVTFTFAAGEGYNDVTPANPELFAGGSALTASGAGGEGEGAPPAFSLALTAPTAVDIEAPAWPGAADVMPVARVDGLDIAWSGASAGELRAIFNTADFSTEVSCVFPASAGAGSIPGDALLELPAGDGILEIELRSSDIERAGTWQIELAAITHATAGLDPAIANIALE